MTAPAKETRFLWLDVETTGLSPFDDLLLEVAAWPSRSADPFDLHYEDMRSWVINHDGGALGACLSPVTWRMHGASNLLAEVVESTLSPGVVETELCTMIDSMPGTWHLAGNSVHFDRGFLNVDLPVFAKRLHHRILDVSSLALAARALGMPIEKSEPAHRAMADVEASVKQAQATLQWLTAAR